MGDLKRDQFMAAYLRCGCISEGMKLHCGIEVEELRLYLYCGQCGKVKFYDQESS